MRNKLTNHFKWMFKCENELNVLDNRFIKKREKQQIFNTINIKSVSRWVFLFCYLKFLWKCAPVEHATSAITVSRFILMAEIHIHLITEIFCTIFFFIEVNMHGCFAYFFFKLFICIHNWTHKRKDNQIIPKIKRKM